MRVEILNDRIQITTKMNLTIRYKVSKTIFAFRLFEIYYLVTTI